MEITGLHYIHTARIALHDNAVLIVRDSRLEHMAEGGPEPTLIAHDNARVIISKSTVSRPQGAVWQFLENATLSWDYPDPFLGRAQPLTRLTS